MPTRPTFQILLLSALAANLHAAPKPGVIWSAEPVGPGEIAMLQGVNWAGVSSIQLSMPAHPERSVTVTPLPSDAQSLRFSLPAHWPKGIYECKIHGPGGVVDWTLNATQPWWMQGDRGQAATPGGWLRIFGRCLASGKPRIELRAGGSSLELPVSKSSPWMLGAALPPSLRTGSYQVWVQNGLGDPSGWICAGSLEVVKAVDSWAEYTVRFADYGATPDDSADDSEPLRMALRDLATHGGGTLKLAPGRYQLSGGFSLPPNVRLQGSGENATYLYWKDEANPPAALLQSPGPLCIEDLSLYAFNYRKGIVVAPASGAQARHITIQRVRARFTPFSITGLSSQEIGERTRAMESAVACEIHADDANVSDCDFAVPSGLAISLQGDDLVCSGNTVHGEVTGWCSIGGGHRAMVEGNDFSSCTLSVNSESEIWCAGNRVSHNYREFREAITTDGCGGGPGDLKVLEVHGATMKVAATASRTDGPKVGAAIRILDGTGAGQWREVKAFDGTNVTMDRPWDVPPDGTSAICMGNAMRHQIIVDNSTSDAGVGVQLYAGALDCVVAGNRSTRSGGFRVLGRQAGPGTAPAWYVEILDNTIDESYGVAGPELGGGTSSIDIAGEWGSPTYHGPTMRGIVIRGNRLCPGAVISLRSNIRDVLVEDNFLPKGGSSITRVTPEEQRGVVIGPSAQP
jgi:hypothetical protein